MPIPKPKSDEKQDEFVQRCHRALADEYDDSDQRHAICMGAWRKKHGGEAPSDNAAVARQLAVMRVKQGVTTRTEMLDGREHIVVPLTALVDGVFQCANCPRPNYYPSAEFGKHPGMWNGRPVTIGHPMRDGAFVSAGSPDVWDVERIGTTFNARMDGDSLKLEAWLDPEAVERAGDEATSVLAAIEAGDQVEVSTAAWVDEVPRVGSMGGRNYEAMQTDFKPDHMALLPLGQVGACSWEDGCGVRVNAASGEIEAIEEARVETTSTSGTASTWTVPTGGRTVDVRTVTVPFVSTDGAVEAVPCDACARLEAVRKMAGLTHLEPEKRLQLVEAALGGELPEDDEGAVARDDTEFVAAMEDGEMADDEKRAAAPPPEAPEGDEPKAQASPMERQLADALAENEHLKAQLARRKAPATVDEYIGQAPQEMRSALVGLLKAQRRRELEQVTAILDVAGDVYDEAELKAMDADQLDRTYRLATKSGRADYSVQQAEHSRLAQAATEAEDQDYAHLPPSPWDVPGGTA